MHMGDPEEKSWIIDRIAGKEKEIKVLQFPRWTLLYTVGPQTYIPTLLGEIDLKVSFLLVNELNTTRELFIRIIKNIFFCFHKPIGSVQI